MSPFFNELKEYASEINIGFFTSVFNVQDVKFLSELQPEIIKIPSHEIHNVELLEECAEKFETILVSTGASYWHEIEKIPSLISDKRLVLMHCVSSYPCDYERVNMKRNNKIQNDQIDKETQVKIHRQNKRWRTKESENTAKLNMAAIFLLTKRTY